MPNGRDFHDLEKILGATFKNTDILRQAMVHRSYLNENPSFALGHNERLEFLGDAVLELVVTEHLFNNYENPEGELTNWRASLVNAKMLATISRELKIEPFLYLSRGETQDANSKAREFILANAMEAIIGAIYLDQGYDAAKKFVNKTLLPKLPEILELGLYMDPKSRFQESAQEILGLTPTYRVLQEKGPDHAKDFLVGVFLSDELVAEGVGSSKQEAQVDAAEKALKIKKWKGTEAKIIKRNT